MLRARETIAASESLAVLADDRQRHLLAIDQLCQTRFAVIGISLDANAAPSATSRDFRRIDAEEPISPLTAAESIAVHRRAQKNE